MSLTKVSYSMIQGASFNILDYGAAGDGVQDDCPAMIAAVAAMTAIGKGGELVFPQVNKSGGVATYRFASTAAFSDLDEVVFTGFMGTINNSQDSATNSRIFWDGPNSTDPIWYFRRGHGVIFRGLVFDGKKQASSTNIAIAGIWVDENHQQYRFYNNKFIRCKLGRRHCSSYNHTTGAWTPGYSAYDGAYSAAAASNGGYASDGFIGEGNTYDCYTAGISIESAQALDEIEIAPEFTFGNTGTYSIAISACQGLQVLSPTFLGASVAEIYCIQNATLSGITIENAHQEGGSQILFTSSNASNDWGSAMVFSACAGGDINMQGVSGTFTLQNCTLRTVSMKSANVSLSIENSTIVSLDKTAGLGNGPLIKLSNVTVTGTLSPHALAYQTLILDKVTFPALTDMALVPTRLSSGSTIPALMLGPPNEGSTVGGMEGISFSNINNNGLFIGYGCYLNAAGTVIATNASGGYITFNSSGTSLKKFTGATIGSTPAVTSGAYA